VPEAVGALLRGRLDEVVDEVIAAVRAEVPQYDQPLEGEFGRLISQGVSVALEEFADLLGHDAELGHLGTYEALGRAEHRAGRTLDALQSAYRVGARVAWRRTAALGEAGGVEPRTMYLVAEAIFAYIDRVAAASVAGFTQEEALRASSVQARRQALVELLARVPPAGEAELARAAADAVWPVPTRVAALAVAEGTAAALARRMPAGTLGAELPGAGVLVLSDPDGPGQPGLVARALGARRGVLGPAVAPPEAHLSIARAVSALPLHAAGALGSERLARTGDHLVALLLAGDPALATDLVRESLAPLDELTEGARARALETLGAWLDAHGDVPTAAKALHVHPQTIRYRLTGLREAFGARLDDPGARLELALALRARTYAAAARGAGVASASATAAGDGDGTGSAAGDSASAGTASDAPPGSA
jgi:hypothetical protein